MQSSQRFLVIGGGGGIGKALSWYFHPTPYNSTDQIEWIAPSSKDLDIRDSKAVDNWVGQTDPDVLLNLAGVQIDNLLHKLTEEEVRNQIDINCIGNINLVSSYAKTRRRRRASGRFIYLSSILSSRPVRGAGIYAACKAFNDNLIRTAALENAKYKITFNSIQLGYFGVGMCERLPAEVQERVLNKDIPMGRFGYMTELYNLIDFFIKTEYATGMNYILSGGM